MNSIEKPAAKIGRPRASRDAPEGPVREEILAAARQLFRTKGFASTSTREIAAAAGLRQPSLFHYFKNKEAIFREVALAAVQPVLDFIGDESTKLAPEVALYRLVWFDTYHLCTNENALGSPFQFPEMTRDRLPEFWELRDALVATYRRVLQKGIRQGVFDVEDVTVATNLLFALGESTLTWYRKPSPASARKVADAAARMALKAVLKDAALLEQACGETPVV